MNHKQQQAQQYTNTVHILQITSPPPHHTHIHFHSNTYTSTHRHTSKTLSHWTVLIITNAIQEHEMLHWTGVYFSTSLDDWINFSGTFTCGGPFNHTSHNENNKLTPVMKLHTSLHQYIFISIWDCVLIQFQIYKQYTPLIIFLCEFTFNLMRLYIWGVFFSFSAAAYAWIMSMSNALTQTKGTHCPIWDLTYQVSSGNPRGKKMREE